MEGALRVPYALLHIELYYVMNREWRGFSNPCVSNSKRVQFAPEPGINQDYRAVF